MRERKTFWAVHLGLLISIMLEYENRKDHKNREIKNEREFSKIWRNLRLAYYIFR